MTKYEEIATILQSEFGSPDTPPGTPVPCERALMARFGVSSHTVRSALRILKEKGVVVRRSRQGTFTAGSQSIGIISFGVLISGSRYSEIFAEICKELRIAAKEHDLMMVEKDASNHNPETAASLALDLAKSLVDAKVNGIIFQPVQFATTSHQTNCAILNLFASARIPVVIIDCALVSYPLQRDYDTVSIDNFRAGERLASWLLQTGSKHIRFQASPGYPTSVADRIRGLESVRNKPGALMKLRPADTEALRIALLTDPDIDTIICQNDLAAVELAHTLRELGRLVPVMG